MQFFSEREQEKLLHLSPDEVLQYLFEQALKDDDGDCADDHESPAPVDELIPPAQAAVLS